MCTTYSALGGPAVPDACDTGGVDNTSEIAVGNQQVATSSVSYGSGQPTPAYALTASTSPLLVRINVLKTVATTTAKTKNTYWGISIPGTITLSGDYTGQNTITAIVSSTTNWY